MRTKQDMNRFRFELLRYVPNAVSGEFYNIGVFLFDENGKMIDARIASDFRRLRCHPLANFELLESLRNEFEERRLLGEGFSTYTQELLRNVSEALQLSDRQDFLGREADAEIERLYQTYVATPTPAHDHREEMEITPGTRRALRRKMEVTFRRYHLLDNTRRLVRDTRVNYGGARLQFTFDYSYRPDGVVKYLHGIALRGDVEDATKLCFVRERLRGRNSPVGVTAVIDDQILSDTRNLLADSEIETCEVSRLGELALAVRRELGL